LTELDLSTFVCLSVGTARARTSARR